MNSLANELKNQKIAFVGAGNMAKAIMTGLIAAGFSAENIMACAPSESTRNAIKESLNTQVSVNNSDAVAFADIIVIAVKPNLVETVANELDLAIEKQATNPLVISVAAGVSTAKLQSCFNAKVSLIAAMPNLPCAVKQGVVGLVAAETCRQEAITLADSLFSQIGKAVWLNSDQQMPALVASAGSSPAYFFLFLESMIASAKTMGLTQKQAEDSVLHSGLGALTMAANSDLSVTELREQVTSPNGTTHQAIESFMQNDIALVVNDAMQAAAKKAAKY